MTSKHQIRQKKQKDSNRKLAIYIIIGVVVVFGAYSFLSGNKGPGPVDDFAKCLADKGAIMYGASWCSHCKAQKELFGNSFQYVNYVECVKNKETCLSAGIEGYPTWVFADGTEQSGEMSLVSLSQRTGCSLS